MAAPLYASIPVRSAVAVPEDLNGKLAKNVPKLTLGYDYQQWLQGLAAQVQAAPARSPSISLQGVSESLPVTPLDIPTVTQGIWRINVTARVTQAADVDSQLQVFVSWTERGVTQEDSSVNLVGNLTTTRIGEVFIIRADAETPISYSTVYVSDGATPMVYSLDVVPESLAPDTVATA